MKKLFFIFCSMLIALVSNAQIMTTIAGNGTRGYSGDGEPAILANLYAPSGVALDALGNIYIPDAGNSCIRKVSASTGKITTVAGNGTSGYSGDGGAATLAQLSSPEGVAVDALGDIYITDGTRIRKVKASTGIINTIAGNETSAYSGDGGPAILAQFKSPYGIAVDALGNIYIADYGGQRIREIIASSGNIITVAGNGIAGYTGDGLLATTTQLNWPSGVAVDASGNIFIADKANNRIRKVNVGTGIITTIAGTGAAGYSEDGVPATSAKLVNSGGISVDSSGNIFISNEHRICKINASNGLITTVAGQIMGGFSGDGYSATSAQLNSPSGVAIDASGNIYIADVGNQRIRKVIIDAPTITSFSPTVGKAGTIITITGTNLTGTSSVSIGGTPASSVTVVNPTTVTAVVTTGATGTIIINTPNGTATSLDMFTFFAAPMITSVTPTSGASGTIITITGTNLTGASAVSFGGTPASSFTVVSATTITAVVGSGSTGHVYIATPGGTAEWLNAFTFISPPSITSFTPTSGEKGTTITITGSNLIGTTTVSIGGTSVSSFKVVNTTTVTAVIGAGSTGAISLTTPSGTVTSSGKFTFETLWISDPTLTISYKGNPNVKVAVRSVSPWTAVTSNVDWLSVRTSNDTINLFVAENTGADRTANVTVSNSTSIKLINVTQLGHKESVNVLNGGELINVLKNKGIANIADLTITGTIDARDFKLMRDSLKSLSTLDISAVSIAAYTGKEGTVSFTSTDTYYPSNTIPQYAFSAKKTLKSIVFPTTAVTIGGGSFANCEGLITVSIPANISTVGTGAFTASSGMFNVDPANKWYTSIDGVLYTKDQTKLVQCPITKLGSFSIPSTVKSLGDGAFGSCIGLTEIIIPTSVSSFGDYTFAQCGSLTSLTIPSADVLALGSYLFYGCVNLSSITLPNSIRTIGTSCFRSCVGLSSIELPTQLTSIGATAFYGCTKLNAIKLPEFITSVEDYAFSNCVAISTINFGPSIATFGDNVFEGCVSLTDVTLPSSVTAIGNNAFSGCTKLSSAVIQGKYATLGNNAFYGCSNLLSINLPDSLTLINDYTFYSCKKLASIKIPSTVAAIGYASFSGCNSLKSVEIPASVASIGNNAFNNCNGLNTLTIPASCSSIGYGAFNGCSGLLTIYANATNPIKIGTSSNVFGGVNKSSCILSVPFGYKDAYHLADQWKEFANINEVDGIKLTTNSLILSNSVGSKGSVDISASNATWSVATDQSWLTLNSTSGSNGKSTLTVVADANLGDIRTANITVNGIVNGVNSVNSVSQSITVTQVSKVASDTIFYDNFDDNYLSSAWKKSGNSVYEYNGILSLTNAVAYSGGAVISSSFNVNNENPIRIYRRTKVTALNNMVAHSFSLAFGKTSDFIVQPNYRVSADSGLFVTYANFDNIYYDIKMHGLYLGDKLALSSDLRSVTLGVSAPATMPLDKWFDEVITYNPVSGDATISVDGSIVATTNIGVLPTENVYAQLCMNTWAASSIGHSLQSDYVTVMQKKSSSSGISSVVSNSLLISPNPASNFLRILGIEQPSSVTILDLKGQIVLSKMIDAHESIAISGLSKGVYVVKITNANKTYERKLIKK